MQFGWRTAALATLLVSTGLMKAAAAQARDLASTLGALENRSYAALQSGDTKFWESYLSKRFVS
jgi:hypothetical protein